ncbi:MAG: SPFH domain-containing protein [Lachnospiraceae bacterium]|nr:SPFH domain-containing protein [Lachnospiraceae bacterium]
MAIVEVVKYDGDPNVFAWKYPSEDLGTWTQLIVNESQEAILFKEGVAFDVFQSGRHTLDTKNIPILNKIVNLPFGGRSPFTAEIWYVNKLFNLDIKWGTASPVQIQDAKYGIFVPIRSNGVFGIQIDSSMKFLTKLVGTMTEFDEKSVIKYFRGMYITKVKDIISSYVVKKKISVLEINAYIDEISSYMKECIEPEMSEYGIKLVSFYVNEISVPEDDPAVKKLTDALAKKAEMDIIGYNYQQERSFDTMESAVKNESMGAVPFMGAGMGIGMGTGVGGMMASAMSGIASQMLFHNHSESIGCPKCHAKMNQGQRFCGSCGYDMQKNTEANSKKIIIKCVKCGAENSGSKFCVECGKKYNPCPKCGQDMEEGAASCDLCGYGASRRCPQCGVDLQAGIKFCPECGASVAEKCPKCDAIIKGNPKFCPECGENLR